MCVCIFALQLLGQGFAAYGHIIPTLIALVWVGCCHHHSAGTRYFAANAGTTGRLHHDLPNGWHMATLTMEWNWLPQSPGAFDCVHSSDSIMCDTLHQHPSPFSHVEMRWTLIRPIAGACCSVPLSQVSCESDDGWFRHFYSPSAETTSWCPLRDAFNELTVLLEQSCVHVKVDWYERICGWEKRFFL